MTKSLQNDAACASVVELIPVPLPYQRSHQIDYCYAPRLATEPAAVHEIRFHPLEPWSFNVIVRKEF